MLDPTRSNCTTAHPSGWLAAAAGVVFAASLLGLATALDAAPLFNSTFLAANVAGSPAVLGAGDFNGDGRPDLIVNDGNGTAMSLLIGNGDGTFQHWIPISANGAANSVAVADLNGDGKADIVVSHPLAAGTVTVLLGNGNGTFATGVDYASGAVTTQVVIGDFNGDGKPDLAASNQGLSPGFAGTVAMLTGHGDGTFDPRVEYPCGNVAVSLAAGDMDGDGDLDLVVSDKHSPSNSISTGYIEVLPNQGNGTFGAPISSVGGPHPAAVRVADFNGDGRLDVALAAAMNAGVSFYRGHGDGTVGAPVELPVGYTNGFDVGDLNGDGYADIVSTQYNVAGTWIMLGNSSGTFAPPHEVYGGGGAVLLFDANLDGHPDIAVTIGNNATGTGMVRLQLGNGSGSVGSIGRYPTGPSPSSIAFGDLEGDGALDVATTNHYQGTTISVLKGNPNGNGTFLPKHDLTSPDEPVYGQIADLDGDGKPDLVVSSESGSAISVWRGYGDGGFYPRIDNPVQPYAESFAIGDIDEDGIPDIVSVSLIYWAVSILHGHGDGTFSPPVELRFSVENPFSIAMGDLDGDGHLDLVVAGQHDLALYHGHGNGTFDPYVVHPAWTGPTYDQTHVALADVNGDGHLDLVGTHPGFNVVSVWLGVGDGTLGAKQDFEVSSRPAGFTVADFDGDGKLDLAVACPDADVISVLLGNGLGGFGSRVDYGGFDSPNCVFHADVNHDGRPDLLTVGDDSQLVVLDNTGGGPIVAVPPRATANDGARLRWLGAQPNPSRAPVSIVFAAGSASRVQVEIVDTAGRRIRHLTATPLGNPEARSVAWDGRDDLGRPARDGVYLARIRAGGQTVSGKIVRIR